MVVLNKLNQESLDKRLEDIHAEIIECVEGCLLDNGLYHTDIGTVAVYETYVNEWTSLYKLVLPNSADDSEKIRKDFYEDFKEQLS